MIPIIQISQKIDKENHNKFNRKSILHLHRGNISDWDTISIERMIPLTEIEVLVGIPYMRDIDNPLTEDELNQYNIDFKDNYNEIEKYILNTTNALFKTFKLPVKEGLIFEVFIYTPFIKYLPKTKQHNITIFYSFVLGNGDIYFNIIELFDKDLREINPNSIMNKVNDLLFNVRTSNYCTSDETYQYLEVNFPERNLTKKNNTLTIMQNYILNEFLKINYDLDIDIEDCIPTVCFHTDNETYKSNDIKINYLSGQSMIVFGSAYKNIENEGFVANIIAKSFLFRVLNAIYFTMKDSDLNSYEFDFHLINLTYLNSFIKNNNIVGLTKIHEDIIKNDYHNRRNKRMKKMTLELSEHLGSYSRGFFKPDGL